MDYMSQGDVQQWVWASWASEGPSRSNRHSKQGLVSSASKQTTNVLKSHNSLPTLMHTHTHNALLSPENKRKQKSNVNGYGMNRCLWIIKQASYRFTTTNTTRINSTWVETPYAHTGLDIDISTTNCHFMYAPLTDVKLSSNAEPISSKQRADKIVQTT